MKTKPKLRRCPPDDDALNESDALAVGLAIVAGYKSDGDSDFDKGMRALQQALSRRTEAEAREAWQRSLESKET